MNNYYEDIPLTLEETIEGIIERQKKKYFHLRNAPYWKEQYRLADELHEEDNRRQREKAAQVRAAKQRA